MQISFIFPIAPLLFKPHWRQHFEELGLKEKLTFADRKAESSLASHHAPGSEGTVDTTCISYIYLNPMRGHMIVDQRRRRGMTTGTPTSHTTTSIHLISYHIIFQIIAYVLSYVISYLISYHVTVPQYSYQGKYHMKSFPFLLVLLASQPEGFKIWDFQDLRKKLGAYSRSINLRATNWTCPQVSTGVHRLW